MSKMGNTTWKPSDWDSLSTKKNELTPEEEAAQKTASEIAEAKENLGNLVVDYIKKCLSDKFTSEIAEAVRVMVVFKLKDNLFRYKEDEVHKLTRASYAQLTGEQIKDEFYWQSFTNVQPSNTSAISIE